MCVDTDQLAYEGRVKSDHAAFLNITLSQPVYHMLALLLYSKAHASNLIQEILILLHVNNFKRRIPICASVQFGQRLSD